MLARSSRSGTPQEASTQRNTTASFTVNERILNKCHKLYTDTQNGLIDMAAQFNLRLLPPRKKIVVLLIGNHSAGKSSFINWYIEENVQRTGVAIETQGFTIVTSGKKRETLLGEATLFLYPHFKALMDIPGVTDFLSTEVSPSKAKKFNLVTFVDSPGLVDGDMQYPFDVNRAVQWMGNTADLIFVFFDPVGQALCKRTLNIVEALHDDHADKIKIYLSKADEAGSEPDRQRVMMQIVQELCKRRGLNRQGFDMPTIYVPDLGKENPRCVNQIDEVCREIEKTINATIQNTLNVLARDCDVLEERLDMALQANVNKSNDNTNLLLMSFFQVLVSCVLFMPAVVFVIASLNVNFDFGFVPNQVAWNDIARRASNKSLAVVVICLLLGFFLTWLTYRKLRGWKSTITSKQRSNYQAYKNYLQKVVRPIRERLYIEYLDQSVGSYDM